jgi:hypothetical protein
VRPLEPVSESPTPTGLLTEWHCGGTHSPSALGPTSVATPPRAAADILGLGEHRVVVSLVACDGSAALRPPY